MNELELKISENEFDTKATKEWFFIFSFDGEQHLIVLPYKKYAELVRHAFDKLSVDEVRNILR